MSWPRLTSTSTRPPLPRSPARGLSPPWAPPNQSGKTTFLEMELGGWTKVDLEDAGTSNLVKSDPALFVRDHPERVWFDEAQRVPELFAALRVGRPASSGSAERPGPRTGSHEVEGSIPFSSTASVNRGHTPCLLVTEIDLQITHQHSKQY